jgi:hypothetical protein
VLRHEWVNARGAIARFERSSIEIRVLDAQETPHMDVAYAALVVAVLKLLCEETWCSVRALEAWRTEDLAELFQVVVRDAETADVGHRGYLAALGLKRSGARLHDVWESLMDAAAARMPLEHEHGRMLEHYLRHGSLAARIRQAVGLVPARRTLERTYEKLCEALAEGEPYTPPPKTPPHV